MKKKILIIDDDIMTLRILKKYLEEDYEIQLENAGYRFVEHVSDYQVDMILLDIEMPIMNGMEVFDAYRKLPHTDIPVVFLSGVTNPQVVREAVDRGAAGYLVKTSPKAELLNRVKLIFAEYSGKNVSRQILLLGLDVSRLKSLREDLENNGYNVETRMSVAESVNIIRRDIVDLLVIVEPMYEFSEKEIYNTICKRLAVSSFPVVLGCDIGTPEDLLDKVGKMIGQKS